MIWNPADITSPMNMIATVATFFIVFHASLIASPMDWKIFVPESLMDCIFSDIADFIFSQICFTESSKPVKNPLIDSIPLCVNSFNEFHALLTQSTKSENLFLIQSMTEPKISFIFVHALVTALRNPSLVFHKVTSAVIRPTIRLTIKMIMFAF